MFSGGAFAQSEKIYTLSNLAGSNTLVRQWVNNKYLLYSEESGNNEKFVIIDNTGSTPTAKEVSLKKWYKIKDFAINNDSVFFIGTYNNTGFWGYFDINNVFNNGGNLTYFRTDNTTTAIGIPMNGMVYSFVNFDELQILTYNGYTELLLTGFRKNDSYVGGMPTFSTYTPCLFHVKPPYTSFDYAYNASSSEKFDDITRSGTDIVVVGRENYLASDSAVILFRIFDEQNFSFLSSPATEQVRQNYNRSLSKILIEAVDNIPGNIFSTAHYGNNMSHQGLYIEYYSIPYNYNSYISRNRCTFAPQDNTLAPGCTLKKIAYNDPSRTLCVLQDMEAPLFNSINSAICKSELANFPNSITYSTSSQADSGISISAVASEIYNNNILYSGKWQSQAILAVENVSAPASCMNHCTLPFSTDYNYHELPYTYMPLTKESFTATRITLFTSPSTTPCDVWCQQ